MNRKWTQEKISRLMDRYQKWEGSKRQFLEIENLHYGDFQRLCKIYQSKKPSILPIAKTTSFVKIIPSNDTATSIQDLKIKFTNGNEMQLPISASIDLFSIINQVASI